MKIAALVLLLGVSNAFADNPLTEFFSAHVSLAKGASVAVHPPGAKLHMAPAPAEEMDVYLWRDQGDPVIFSDAPIPANLFSRGSSEIEVTLVGDAFEITKPEPAVVVTGHGTMTINANVINKVQRGLGPLNEKVPGHFVFVPGIKAQLLRKGEPNFTCSLGHQSADGSLRRYLLSWSSKLSKKDFAGFCVEDSKELQHISKDQLKALSNADGVLVLEFAEDDC